MYVDSIGSRRYAFGLQWIDRGEDLAESLRGAMPPEHELGESIVYTTPKPTGRKHDDYGTVGFFAADKKQSQALYSAAGTIAAKCEDGLYVLRLEGGDIWYCGVRRGVVIEGTDVIADAGAGEDAIEELAATLELPIRLEPESDLVFDASEAFSVQDYLAHAKGRPMRLYRQGPKLLVPVVVAAVVLLAGAYFFTVGGSKQERLTPAQKRAKALAQYVSGAKQRIGSFPTANGWVKDAFNDAVVRFPPFLFGWTLHGVSCLPDICTATYAVGPGDPYQIAPMRAHFKQTHLSRSGRELTVTHALATPLVAIDQSWLRTLPSATTGVGDWVGALPLTMPDAKVVGTPLTVNVGQQFHASQAGMPSAVMEQVQIEGSDWLTTGYLNGLIRAGAHDGFRVLKVEWTADPVKASKWSLVWGRVHG